MTPAQHKRAARELIGLAQQHLEEYTVIGAIEHVYQMAVDRALPWACSEVLDIAEDGIDRARHLDCGQASTASVPRSALRRA